ncbi:YtpR family tRNA-binding protein [Furfurilactobacillus sp. WILCCON 0119]
MLIASMNQQASPDVLVVILGPDVSEQAVTVTGNIARIFDPATDQTLGYNFLNVSAIDASISGNGQLALTDAQVAALNQALTAANMPADLENDHEPRFVVGYVEATTPHPDSDHLLVTTTRIDNDQTVQIVSGSPNMTDHIYVVVAKVGAMMPSGQVIWPGELRGVPSNGMITSGRELRLKNAPQKKGALILPDDFAAVGTPFDFEKGNTLFA